MNKSFSVRKRAKRKIDSDHDDDDADNEDVDLESSHRMKQKRYKRSKACCHSCSAGICDKRIVNIESQKTDRDAYMRSYMRSYRSKNSLSCKSVKRKNADYISEYRRKRNANVHLNETRKRKRRCIVHVSNAILCLSRYDSMEKMCSAVKPIHVGSLNTKCQYCGSYNFELEKLKSRSTKTNFEFAICCQRGRVNIPTTKPPPTVLKSLFAGNDNDSKIFKKHIQSINNDLAFASLMASHVKLPPGPPVFKIQGQTYHRMGPLLPADSENPKYVSVYLHDTQHELLNRAKRSKDSSKYLTLLSKLCKGRCYSEFH